MSDMILWIVALGIGGLGLLLLGVAGVAAAAIGSAERGRRPAEAAPSVGRATVAPTSGAGRSTSGQDTSDAGPDATGTLWAWVKACVFALIHAGVVSFVLGGLTFFEDLVRANGEIRRTGNVSFPRQLLPSSLGGNQPSGADEAVEAAYAPRYQPAGALRERDLPPISAAEWKVVDILDEAGPAGEALVGDYRPRPH